MTERLFGIETEYALVPAGGTSDRRCTDRITSRFVQRAEELLPSVGDEGGRSRFLSNGSRFYVDCGHHPEWSTAELGNPWDAVRHVLAGERWLVRVAESLKDDGGLPALSLFKTNVDPSTRVSWGCHESVLYRNCDAGALAEGLLPFLATRAIYTGAGGFDPFSPGLEFVMSPRATFLQRDTSGESTSNRAIVHLKQESLCGHGFRRWHLICGESLNSEIAMWLRSATLVLGVSLLEGGVDLGAPVRLASPLGALRAVIRDPTCQAVLEMEDGTGKSPLQIQRYYLEQAEAHAGADFMPPWAGAACHYWRAMLDRLESAPDSIATTLDWAIKRALFTRLLERRGFTWDRVGRWNQVLRAATREICADPEGGRALDPAELVDPPAPVRAILEELEPVLAWQGLAWAGLEAFVRVRRELLEANARFSELGDSGLFTLMDRDGALTHHVEGVDNIEHAMEYPPSIGRAGVRGAVIRRVQPDRQRFTASWSHVVNGAERTMLDLSHPFETEERWESPGTLRRQMVQGEPLPDELPPGAPPFVRRDWALRALLRGDSARAQALLDELVFERFDPPSTWCHAARLAIVRSAMDRARALVEEAWSLRMHARPYVVSRILWFRALFAMLEGSDPSPWLGRLKDFLARTGDRSEWIMCPVLERVRPQLTDERHALLDELVDLLSSAGDGGSLDRFPEWREAAAAPFFSAEPTEQRPDCTGAHLS